MDQPSIEAELKRLTKMLVTLGQMGVVTLDPSRPASWQNAVKPAGIRPVPVNEKTKEEDEPKRTRSRHRAANEARRLSRRARRRPSPRSRGR
jgi:hypothetical protein